MLILFISLTIIFFITSCLILGGAINLAWHLHLSEQLLETEMYKNIWKHLTLKTLASRRKALRKHVLQMEKINASRKQLIQQIDQLIDEGLTKHNNRIYLIKIHNILMKHFGKEV